MRKKVNSILGFILFVGLLLPLAGINAQQLFINEFLADNVDDITDEYGDHDDWIEIYNGGDDSVNVAGLYITDDLSEPLKWRISSLDSTRTTIPPNGFLILWADGTPTQSLIHLGFRLSANGEAIGLYDADSSRYIDSLSFGPQTADISQGRQPDGGPVWNFFNETTPGAANNTNGNFGFTETPQFSVHGGMFNNSVSLELSCTDTNAVIYYTLNSSTPTTSSAVYDSALTIDTLTTLRAVAIAPGYLPSPVVTHTYLLNFPSTIPVISLVTDSSHIWGPTGIYNNRSANWEKPVSVELFESDGETGIRQNGGIKIHAPDSRPQQSFRIYARDSYGDSYFRYRLFPDKPITLFKRFVLRNGGNDGSQLGVKSHMRDAIMHVLYRQENIANISAGYRPSHVFLNGNYWGLYNIRERQDEHFIETNYGSSNIDLLERAFNFPGNRNAIVGNWTEYNLLEAFAEENDLNDPANFAQIETMMDVENFRDYWIYEIFAGNFDWLSNNIRMWRPRTPDGIFRWMMWDLDHGLGLPFQNYGVPSWNTLEWATDTTGVRVENGKNTLLIRSLLENDQFRHGFINRFGDLLNTTFSTAHTHQVVDSLKNILLPEMPLQIEQWGHAMTFWEEGVLGVKFYLQKRPGFVKQHIMSKFGLDDSISVNLAVSPPGSGHVRINTLSLNSYPWEGIYFKDVPITFRANPLPGYRFVGWSAGPKPDSQVFLAALSHDLEMTALFEADTSQTDLPPLVINEINYAASPEFDTKDWVELYNTQPNELDVSGWFFQDNNTSDRFVFPIGSIIPASGYAILSRDSIDFRQFFPGEGKIYGEIDFGLSSQGEHLQLFDSASNLIDELTYGINAPWPVAANGGGPTLELLNSSRDNDLAENWQASREIGGSPGWENSTLVGIPERENGLPATLRLSQNYPNPFNPQTTVAYALPAIGDVDLAVYDILGRKVVQLVREKQNAGFYQVLWDGKNHLREQAGSGIYIYRLTVNGINRYRKMILLR